MRRQRLRTDRSAAFAQESFELGKGQFDWVEVGRVLRQVEKCGARGLDGFTHPCGKMGFNTVSISV